MPIADIAPVFRKIKRPPTEAAGHDDNHRDESKVNETL
jgi:hypothetical protein